MRPGKGKKMNNRILWQQEKIRSSFLALEAERDCSQYCVSVDGEVIIRNTDIKKALKNYEITKKNLLLRNYARQQLIKD